MALGRRYAIVSDLVPALVVAAFTVPSLLFRIDHEDEQLGPYLVYTVLLVIPLFWRRRFPLSTFAAVAAVAFVQWIAGVQAAADVGLLVALYTVASRYPMRIAAPAAGVLEIGTVLFAVQWPQTPNRAETVLLLSGPVLASLTLGANVRHRRNALDALRQRAAQLERERDQQAVIAAAEERTRIAREMHDVVAHSLSVMVALSEGAVLKHATEPDRATEAMRQVSTTGRQALDEMRRLLGVLRTEDAPDAPRGRQPQPDIERVDELLEQVRATGLAASATVTGTPTAMAPGAELAVYRIVQEALTNTLKHATAPTRVSVAIAYRPYSVTVDVRDDGTRRPVTGTAGHGLIGMRERAAVYGGTVSAGPDPAGGWRIRATLPMSEGGRVR